MLVYLLSFLFHILALFALEISNLKIKEIVPEDRSQIIKIESVESLTAKDFYNKDAVFWCEKGNSVIMHSKKLNTIQRSGLSLFDENEDNDNTWYEFEKSLTHLALGSRIPATGCLNSEHGDGGTLQGTITRTFGTSVTLDLKYGFTVANYFSPQLENTLNLATGFTISATFSCTIPSKGVGQMFVQAYFDRLEEGRYRLWKPTGELRKFGHGYKNTLAKSDWTTVRGLLIPSNKQRPVISCVTDPDQLECPLPDTNEPETKATLKLEV